MSKPLSQLAIDLEQILKQEFANKSDELAMKVKQTMQQEIEAEVYNVYPDPKVYQRQKDNGGLQDLNNMPHQLEDDGLTLDIGNTTTHDNKNIALLVEKGNGANGIYYDFPYHEEYTQPRPFMKSTYEHIVKDGIEKWIDRNVVGNAVKKLNKG